MKKFILGSLVFILVLFLCNTLSFAQQTSSFNDTIYQKIYQYILESKETKSFCDTLNIGYPIIAICDTTEFHGNLFDREIYIHKGNDINNITNFREFRKRSLKQNDSASKQFKSKKIKIQFLQNLDNYNLILFFYEQIDNYIEVEIYPKNPPNTMLRRYTMSLSFLFYIHNSDVEFIKASIWAID